MKPQNLSTDFWLSSKPATTSLQIEHVKLIANKVNECFLQRQTEDLRKINGLLQYELRIVVRGHLPHI